MAGKNLARLLAKAKKAYHKQNRRNGAKLVDEILKEDFNHTGVWHLLYQQYGSDQEFEGFRRAFVKKYYPSQIQFLREIPAEAILPQQKKPSFLSLITNIFKKKPQKEPIPTGPRPTEPERFIPSENIRNTSPQWVAEPAAIPTFKGLITPPSAGKPNIAVDPQPSKEGKIRVLVVDDIPETRNNIIRSLLFSEDIEVIGTAENGLQGVEQTKILQPEVVVMDVNMPDMDGIQATAAIRREAPATQVIILTVQDDIDYMRNAMLAGARDFLSKPPMIDELASAVRRAGAYARQETAKSLAGQAEQMAGAKASQTSNGKIFCIYSPRGGAGCTMIAANLAVSLNREETPVVIADGNFHFGDVTALFNVQGGYSILDLAPSAGELDQNTIEKVLLRHESGVRILAPTRPEDAEQITGEQFQNLLQYFTRFYSYVLVDIPTQLNDTTLAALEISDLVILVVTQDIPALARTRKFLDLAPLIKLDPNQIIIAVNQFDKRIGITQEKLTETLKKEISAVIPLASEIVIPSINRGVPFMLQKNILAQPIGRAMLDLVEATRQKIASLEPDSAGKKIKA